MIRVSILLLTLLSLSGCYSLGTVSYPMYPEGNVPAHVAKLSMGRGSEAYFSKINGVPVQKSIWHKLGDAVLPWVTLGYIETVYDVPADKKLNFAGGVVTSSSYKVPGYNSTTTYTSTYWYSGEFSCTLPAKENLVAQGSFSSRLITIAESGSSRPVCQTKL